MNGAPEALTAFLHAARAAFTAQAQDPRSQASLGGIFSALADHAALAEVDGARLPVCDLLAPLLDPVAIADPVLRRFAVAFTALEPAMVWRRRPADNATAGPGFADGHANAMIVGPGGMVPRDDVWLGVSLLAPHIRYPDHHHAPEETYLVVSRGAFRQGGGAWFAMPAGGSFYNPPGIVHAMRAGDAPLLAFWALRRVGVAWA